MTQIGRMAGSICQPAPLTNCVNIPAVLVAGATAMQNSPFSSLMVAVTIASTHCAYPWRDGQAELAWVAGYGVRQFTYPKAVRTGLDVEQLRWSSQRVTVTPNRHLVTCSHLSVLHKSKINKKITENISIQYLKAVR